MKITFLGAARTVTGSCYLIEVGEKKMLVGFLALLCPDKEVHLIIILKRL